MRGPEGRITSTTSRPARVAAGMTCRFYLAKAGGDHAVSISLISHHQQQIAAKRRHLRHGAPKARGAAEPPKAARRDAPPHGRNEPGPSPAGRGPHARRRGAGEGGPGAAGGARRGPRPSPETGQGRPHREPAEPRRARRRPRQGRTRREPRAEPAGRGRSRGEDPPAGGDPRGERTPERGAGPPRRKAEAASEGRSERCREAAAEAQAAGGPAGRRRARASRPRRGGQGPEVPLKPGPKGRATGDG